MTETSKTTETETAVVTPFASVESLSEEEIADRYQKPPVPRDPNTPISSDDPNDKIRAEGPEVADPAKEAAKVLYETAAAVSAQAEDYDPESEDRTPTIAATGPNSGAADTSKTADAPAS